MSLVQFNGSQDQIIETVWYAGTATLQEGSPLYYDLDDTNAPVVDSWDPSVDPGPNQISTTGNRNLRGNRVIDVNATNVGQLAGVVAPQSSGKVGPAFVDVIRPIRGTVCNVLVSYNTALKGDLVATDEATPSNTFGTAKFAAAGAATAITATSIAAVLVQIMQTGPTTGVTATAPTKLLARFL